MIGKVIGIGKEEVLVVDSYENSLVATGYVKKHSPNIIDLIDSINRHDLYNQMKYFSVDENKDYLAFHYQANQAYFWSSTFH